MKSTCRHLSYLAVTLLVGALTNPTPVFAQPATVNPAPRDARVSSIVQRAAELAAQPIIKRPISFGQISAKYLDTRAAILTNNRQEIFALAMADCFIAWELSENMPLMAVASRETTDPAIRARILAHLFAQLEEMATWHPISRPGWTLYQPGPPAPAGYRDGNWLATGIGIRGLEETLRILGAETTPALRAKLHALLAAEVASVQDDFAAHRPWYWDTPVSNQYVLPNVGVVLACVELGREQNADAYEFGVTNLLRSLDQQGPDGVHHEGTRYGAFTSREILVTALATARTGDRRLLNHPYLVHYGNWLEHLLQPGDFDVNFFDGTDRKMTFGHLPGAPLFGSGTPTQGEGVLACLQLWTMATGRPDGRGLIRQVFPSVPSSALGLEYEDWAETQPAATTLPAPYAAFATSPLVTWRSSWAPDADGVWVRGGSASDSHDHRDHGHVNYIVGGREVLIEAGSTDYAVIMRTPEAYQGGMGHNVLQIGNSPGGPQRKGGEAPIAVSTLNEQGGDVSVDAGASYDPALLQAWRRHVTWSQHGLQVDDAVTLVAGKPDVITFRWHLAQNWNVTATPADGGKSWQVTWAGGAIRLSADAPLTVITATLPQGISYNEQGTHTCLVVSSAQAVSSLHLHTAVKAGARPH